MGVLSGWGFLVGGSYIYILLLCKVLSVVILSFLVFTDHNYNKSYITSRASYRPSFVQVGEGANPGTLFSGPLPNV